MKVVRRYVVAAMLSVVMLGSVYAHAAEPRVARAVAQPRTVAAGDTSRTLAGDLAQARAELARLRRTYRLLDGVTVSFGRVPGGYQAVSYYTVGQIVVSPSHSASITDIINHEVWHVIDWRDNDRLDWGETIPPSNRSDYLRR